MGALTEGNIFSQLKKGQGETNTRLDALLSEQKRTNELLEQLLGPAGSDARLAQHRTG